MNFQKIRPVTKPDEFLDIAFAKAKKRIALMKDKGFKSLNKQKQMEYVRMDIIKDALEMRLIDILKDFPDISALHVFYQELIKLTVDYVALKKSLGAVNATVKLIKDMHKEYIFRFRRANRLIDFNKLRWEFYGRISSIIKRIKPELTYLEECRQVMKGYPDIKELKTVAIAGFPNVGKTTLLNKLSPAKAEVAAYAFTTTGLNLGYVKFDSTEIQLIDTPGTLNRLEKMNNVEKQAYLVIKHLADLIVYVFDLSEPYPLKDQEKLFKHLRQEKKPILAYFSKSDILDLSSHEALIKKYKGITDAEKLKEKLQEKIHKLIKESLTAALVENIPQKL